VAAVVVDPSHEPVVVGGAVSTDWAGQSTSATTDDSSLFKALPTNIRKIILLYLIRVDMPQYR
jgi:hypothetical protein